MISSQFKDLIHPNVLVQRVVWIAITGSIIFYFVFVYIFVREGRTQAFEKSEGLEAVLYAAAAITAICSILYRRYSLSDERLTKILNREIDIRTLAKSSGTGTSEHEKLARLEALSDFEKKVLSLMCDLQKSTHINLIINETVAILGLVLAFLSGDPLKIIPFGIVSLLLNIWMFPRPEAILEKAQNLFRA